MHTRQSQNKPPPRLVQIVTLCCALCTSSCVLMHHRNPLRQGVEYRRVTSRLGEDRLKRIKESGQRTDGRPLSDEMLGTDEATLYGVFVGLPDEGTQDVEVLIATQNFNTIEFTEREQLPYELDTTLIVDSAKLTSRSPRTCIELVLNSDALYDLPIAELSPTLELDSDDYSGSIVLEEERVTPPVSYWYERRTRLFWKVDEVFDHRLRTATVCVDHPARQVVTLKLFNDLYSVRQGEQWVLAFRWHIAGR